jgi:hypothetical protein
LTTVRAILLPIILSIHIAAAGDIELPHAPQLFYQDGVPHTDRNGRIRTQLDAASFFPRCAYESMPNMLAVLRRAGFNCFKPWNGLALESVLPEAQHSGMQLIRQLRIAPCNFSANPACNPEANAAAQIASQASLIAAHASDSSILGWYIEEEPTACILPPSNCAERLANYRSFTSAIKTVDHVHPSFTIDISVPNASALANWQQLNTIGDVACNDSYPFAQGTESSLDGAAANFVSLVELNQQRKPVWITLQAFEQPSPHPPHWKMPTPVQLRAEVFNAIIHGATGIIYFALDDWAVRGAQVIGIAPEPPASYPNHNPGDVVATSEEIVASQTLWNATVSLNAELEGLQPVLLSPTASLSYRVAIRRRGITATPIRSMLKLNPAGGYTLLVVNVDDTPLQTRFSFAQRPADVRAIAPDGTARLLEAQADGFEDSIDGFGVGIYQFR